MTCVGGVGGRARVALHGGVVPQAQGGPRRTHLEVLRGRAGRDGAVVLGVLEVVDGDRGASLQGAVVLAALDPVGLLVVWSGGVGVRRGWAACSALHRRSGAAEERKGIRHAQHSPSL